MFNVGDEVYVIVHEYVSSMKVPVKIIKDTIKERETRSIGCNPFYKFSKDFWQYQDCICYTKEEADYRYKKMLKAIDVDALKEVIKAVEGV